MKDEEKEKSIEKKREAIIESGNATVEGKRGTFYCLSIIGQIEGHYALEQNQKTTKRTNPNTRK